MKRLLPIIAFLLFSTFPFCLQSQTLDQSQLNYNAGTSARNLPGYSHFQSFTAGLTGTLVQIDMGVFNFINGTGTLIIYEGNDTTGIVLQTTQVNVNCPSGNCFATFTVSAPVVTGQVYCFRFIPGNGVPDPYGVQVEVPGTYAGGEFAIIDPSGVYFPGFDQVFRTYVLEATGLMNVSQQKNNLTIIPNPFSTLAEISLNENLNNAEIKLINSKGIVVRTINNFSGNKILIEKENLIPGVYMIQISDKLHNQFSEKIIVWE